MRWFSTAVRAALINSAGFLWFVSMAAGPASAADTESASACPVRCATKCETACQDDCPSACQTACETDCQTKPRFTGTFPTLGWFEQCVQSVESEPVSEPGDEPSFEITVDEPLSPPIQHVTDFDRDHPIWNADLDRPVSDRNVASGFVNEHHGVLINDLDLPELGHGAAPVLCEQEISASDPACCPNDCVCPSTFAEASGCDCPFSACPEQCAREIEIVDPESVNTILDVMDELGGSVTESPELELLLPPAPGVGKEVQPRDERRGVREALADFLRRLDRNHRRERRASHAQLPEPEPVAPHVAMSPEAVEVLREAAVQLEFTANMLEHHDLYEQADQLRHQASLLREQGRAAVELLRLESPHRGPERPGMQAEIERLRRRLAELESALSPRRPTGPIRH